MPLALSLPMNIRSAESILLFSGWALGHAFDELEISENKNPVWKNPDGAIVVIGIGQGVGSKAASQQILTK